MSKQLSIWYLGVTDSCSYICVLYSWFGVVLLDFTQAVSLAIYGRAVPVQTTWMACVYA